MSFLDRFYCFVDDEPFTIDEGVTVFAFEFMNVVVFGIEVDDNDFNVVLCNIVFGFEYR